MILSNYGALQPGESAPETPGALGRHIKHDNYGPGAILTWSKAAMPTRAVVRSDECGGAAHPSRMLMMMLVSAAHTTLRTVNEAFAAAALEAILVQQHLVSIRACAVDVRDARLIPWQQLLTSDKAYLMRWPTGDKHVGLTAVVEARRITGK